MERESKPQITEQYHHTKSVWFSDKVYRPLQAGSLDGTGVVPHDRALIRASKAKYTPEKDAKIQGNPYKTLFVGRLNKETTEDTLQKYFSKFGRIDHLRLVRDIVTGFSKGYAFITFAHSSDFFYAWKEANQATIDGFKILVDFERERLVKGWVPRRYGGGLGGKKESGQVRFGGRERPFRVPFSQPIPQEAFQRFERNSDKWAGYRYRPTSSSKSEQEEGQISPSHQPSSTSHSGSKSKSRSSPSRHRRSHHDSHDTKRHHHSRSPSPFSKKEKT